jgi:5-formyltetrahydrofolate cyclo-ligase
MNDQLPESVLIRQEKRRYRQSLNSQAISQASARARDRLLQCKAFVDANTVAIYYPAQGELDPLPLLEACPDKKFALPVIITEPEKQLHFYGYDKQGRMQANKFGIEEPLPHPEKKISLAAIDVIITPMVAFDAKKNRMGHGAGFYDRTLIFPKGTVRPTLIGFAYDWQQVSELPVRPWDVPMDLVVTDKAVYR